MTRFSAAAAVSTVLTGALLVVGCSSPETAPGDGCVASAAAALRTCAAGETITGVDISSYQGNVNWSQIKGSGRSFAFARISDGLNSPDSKFVQNWPAMKRVGLVRGAYQYFRPSQDPAQQAQMVLDKLASAGGLRPGDLPPVLDLESADSLSASVVVANAKIWLAKIEAAIGVKPIVYTAAFMSDVIGTSFGGYALWVANYTTACPSMPSGWTSWHFWQNADNGTVAGVSGNVDTDFFNGTVAQLKDVTIQNAISQFGEEDTTVEIETQRQPADDKPNDGSQGATIGSGTPKTDETTGAPITPCR